MKRLVSFLFLIFALPTYSQNALSSQSYPQDAEEYKCTLSTSWLSLSNFGKPETNTHHYEIRLSYQLSAKDQIGLKVTSWKLFAPMGIDIWDEQFLDRASFFPGRLKETGLGITYQRKLWKGLFATLEVLPLFTKYLDESEKEIANGFKLYNSYHLGYHIPLFKRGRFYLEPQLHVNHWPINTNVPESFKAKEDQWDNYFFFEPNLYLGIKF